MAAPSATTTGWNTGSAPMVTGERDDAAVGGLVGLRGARARMRREAVSGDTAQLPVRPR